ncbi:replication licensing factor Cdt1 [Halocaridina rubra]|uniref:Replication licensing factor Cdt1 n=1 Tax=Halocaridina rubra TaxID=373956 RepID=A0AAN8X616_HALRR
MASTQASLHQFYKTKKSARDANILKNAKNTIVRDSVVKCEEESSKIIEEIPPKPLVEEFKLRTASVTPVPKFNSVKASKPIVRKGVGKRERPLGTPNIDTIFERVAAAKRKREEEEEEDNVEIRVTSQENSESSEKVRATPPGTPVTPKRKKEETEEEKKKRRKQANEDGLDLTPRAAENVPLNDTPKSAKKKLILGVENSAKSGTVQEADSIGSPRKLLSPKKLTPAEIKERLGRCGRLDELRAKLLKVNQCGEKIRQFKESKIVEQCRSSEYPSPRKTAPCPQLEKFAALDVEVPISPRKTPVKTPTKTPVKAPAHERYQHLTEKPSGELVLPYKYRFAKEVFRVVDTVVSLLHNRQEVITFSRLKSAVQEMLRRTFYERYLGEIKTVFPLAYFFKQEVAKNIGRAAKVGSGSGYELTISPNMEYKSAAQNLMSKFDAVPQTAKFRKMDSIVMVERRNIFHNSLIDILKEHHGEFLKTLDPPILQNSANIKRWHPAFPLEDIPGIEPSPLPQPPTTDKLETAKDILTKAHDLFSVNPRLEKAVADAAAKIQDVPDSATTQSPKQNDIVAALKGVSSSLLEKIRAKEAAKAARDMTRSKSENKELEMLSRLPEISRIIRNIFVTEKKAALPWETVSSKIAASYPSMLAGNEVDSHLHLLIKEVPGWCTIHNVRSGTYVKINKNEPQSNINERIQAVVKQRQ